MLKINKIIALLLLIKSTNLLAVFNLAADTLEDYLSSITTTSLKTGDTFEIDERIKKITIGFGWDPDTNTEHIDMDLNLHVIKKSKYMSKIIWHDNPKYQTRLLTHKQDLIFHTGDNVTGEGEGDDESISVLLGRLNKHKKEVSHLVVTVVIYSDQSFQAINNANCRIVAETESGYIQELVRYDLSEQDDEKAIVLFSVYKSNHKWVIKAIRHGVNSIKGHSMVLATDCEEVLADLLASNKLN